MVIAYKVITLNVATNEIAAVLDGGRPTLQKIPLHSVSCKECVG
jgi:hypothetical protein